MRLAGLKLKPDTLLLASILDTVSIIKWLLTKDAKTGANRPESIVKVLTQEKKQDDIKAFDSPDAFEAALAKLKG